MSHSVPVISMNPCTGSRISRELDIWLACLGETNKTRKHTNDPRPAQVTTAQLGTQQKSSRLDAPTIQQITQLSSARPQGVQIRPSPHEASRTERQSVFRNIPCVRARYASSRHAASRRSLGLTM